LVSVPLPLDDQLCFSLYSTSLAVQRTYKPLLDRLGLTYPQYLVLHALHPHDSLSIGAVAARLSLPASTLTPLVQRLEAAGLVLRARNPADERLVEISLTTRGRELLASCGCLAEAMVARSGFSAEALATLNRQVQALRDALIRTGAADGPSRPEIIL
jgi:MarR family transcriptional regulator, organic hydroperoxide resistance regulator